MWGSYVSVFLKRNCLCRELQSVGGSGRPCTCLKWRVFKFLSSIRPSLCCDGTASEISIDGGDSDTPQIGSGSANTQTLRRMRSHLPIANDDDDNDHVGGGGATYEADTDVLTRANNSVHGGGAKSISVDAHALSQELSSLAVTTAPPPPAPPQPPGGAAPPPGPPPPPVLRGGPAMGGGGGLLGALGGIGTVVHVLCASPLCRRSWPILLWKPLCS